VLECVAVVCNFILVQTDVAGPMKDTRERKYQEDFVKSVFTSIVINGDKVPRYVICCEVLANTLM
jgi:hypothetical protein